MMKKFNEINELLNLIDKSTTFFIANNVDYNVLTDSEKALLLEFGIDAEKFSKETKFDHLYKFGILAETLQQDKVRLLSYDNFLKYLGKNQFAPLTTVEQIALSQIKFQAYSDIKGLGNKIKQGIQQVFIEADKNQRNTYQSIIEQELDDAVYWRKTTKQMASQLGHRTQDWTRDFDRISDFLMHSVLDQGIARGIIRKNGIDAEVYKDVYAGACDTCISLLLTGGIGSEPKIFKVSELIANGSNIGKKQIDWLPVLGGIHPHSITDSRTSILTEKGYKAIKDIEIGDMVLTHKGRFRRVVSKISNFKPTKQTHSDSRIFHINFSIQSQRKEGRKPKISVTAEHKILTNRGWIEAKDLLITDKLIKLLKPCLNNECNNLLDYSVDSSVFCCSECRSLQSSVNMKQKWGSEGTFLSKEQRQSISEKVKENWDKGLHSNTLLYLQSEPKKQQSAARLNNNQTALKMMKKAGFCMTSKPQKRLFELVKCLFDDAEIEYEILGKSLDIAIPSKKINIEFDGAFWHKDRKQQDFERDNLLMSNGWHVIRYEKIPHISNLKKDIFILSNNSEHKYGFIEIPIDSIEVKHFTDETKLWDIGVDEDESFIARGVVVHNCRCTLQAKPKDNIWNPLTRAFTTIKENTNERIKGKTKITIS